MRERKDRGKRQRVKMKAKGILLVTIQIVQSIIYL